MSAHVFIFAGFSPHPKKKYPSLDFSKIVPIVLAIPRSGVLCVYMKIVCKGVGLAAIFMFRCVYKTGHDYYI
ncbi:MAG TPA: hypothetical protein ENK33_09215 [Desulfobacterales bacterium]|nr:hypothetical protein [Desulfobacterales bacterium]